MARIYRPRQRMGDQRWDMTVGSDEEGWTHPIGYCTGWRDWTAEEAARIGISLDDCLRDQEKLLPYKAKFHKDGHATAAEATVCWRAHVLDTELEFRDAPNEQKKCVVCDAWTTNRAHLGHDFPATFVLCLQHATRDEVELAARKDRTP